MSFTPCTICGIPTEKHPLNNSPDHNVRCPRCTLHTIHHCITETPSLSPRKDLIMLQLKDKQALSEATDDQIAARTARKQHTQQLRAEMREVEAWAKNDAEANPQQVGEVSTPTTNAAAIAHALSRDTEITRLRNILLPQALSLFGTFEGLNIALRYLIPAFTGCSFYAHLGFLLSCFSVLATTTEMCEYLDLHNQKSSEEMRARMGEFGTFLEGVHALVGEEETAELEELLIENVYQCGLQATVDEFFGEAVGRNSVRGSPERAWELLDALTPVSGDVRFSRGLSAACFFSVLMVEA